MERVQEIGARFSLVHAESGAVFSSDIAAEFVNKCNSDHAIHW